MCREDEGLPGPGSVQGARGQAQPHMTTRHTESRTRLQIGEELLEKLSATATASRHVLRGQQGHSPSGHPLQSLGQEWPSELPYGGGSSGSLPCARGPETCSHLSGLLCLCATLPLSESRLPLQGSPWGHRAVCHELPVSRASLRSCSASPSRASSVPCHHPSSAPFPATLGCPSPLPSLPFQLNHAPGKVPKVPITPPPSHYRDFPLTTCPFAWTLALGGQEVHFLSAP